MSIDRLPVELIVEIIGSRLPLLIDADEYLALRLLNRRFNHIVLYALFDLRVCDIFIHRGNRTLTRNPDFVFRYWRAVLNLRQTRTARDDSNEDVAHHKQQYDPDGDERQHESRVQKVLLSAIARIARRLEFIENTITLPGLSPLIQPDEILTLHDKCLYILCMTSIQLHDKHHTWYSLTENREHSHFANQPGKGGLYIPNHHEITWELYAAAYLNHLEVLKKIIESIRMHPEPRRVWRFRLSQDWGDFVVAPPWHTPVSYEDATLNEQRWIKAASSALIIAACMGHTEIIEFLMRTEPYLSRNGPRTSLWGTSLRSAMGQAVVYEQREAFKVFLKYRWPLLTSTGFPRMNWWNGLRIAVESVQDRLDGDSIFESMLDMSSDWKCAEMVNYMLQAAASRNNLQLAKVVLDRLHRGPTFLTYSFVSTSPPLLPGYLRAYALGTAAWYGRVDLVDLLLKTGQRMDYAGPEARTCAIHALICHLPLEHVTDEHLTILENLLRYTDSVVLGPLLIKAACNHGIKFVSKLIQNFDLSQKCPITRIGSVGMSYGCSPDAVDMKGSAFTSSAVDITWGELLLATTLKKLKFDLAQLLISEYQVSLLRYFVKERTGNREPIGEHVAILRGCINSSRMTMEVNTQKPTGDTTFEFRPTGHPEPVPFEMRMYRSIYCSL